MNALEPEPEEKTRGRRLFGGLVMAAVIAVGGVTLAKHVKPTMRLMPEILQMAVVDDVPEPPKQAEPPPPPPPPPPPKQQKKEEPEPEAPPEKEEAQPDAPPDDSQAGLDGESFASGSGGPSFRVGKTQMGDPNKQVLRRIEAPKVSAKAPKFTAAHAVDPVLPEYPDRARKLNIQGFVILEAEIDALGKLLGIHVRQGLEQGLDQLAMASVKQWRFQPASLDGRAVPSKRMIRIQFQLD